MQSCKTAYFSRIDKLLSMTWKVHINSMTFIGFGSNQQISILLGAELFSFCQVMEFLCLGGQNLLLFTKNLTYSKEIVFCEKNIMPVLQNMPKLDF